MRRGIGAVATLVTATALSACAGDITPGTGPTGTGPGGQTVGGTAGTGAGTTTGSTMGPGTGTTGSLPPGSTMTTDPACKNAPLARGGAYVRRLTRWEYASSVADVLKIAAPAGLTDLLPADIRANGFSNDFAGQLVSVDHATSYGAAADAVGAALAKAPASWLAPFAACTTTAATCRDQLVAGLGLRLFRRPLTAAESTAFGALFDAAVANGQTTAPAAATVVVRGMLQAPQFLYRLEAQTAAAGAAARPLDNYEIASRLSYFLWASAPDEALLAAAKAGELTSPDKLRAQVTRMLTGARARDVIQRYFREWLSLDDLDDANRGAAFTPELSAAMKQETLDVVGADLWDAKNPLVSMFTSKSTIVSSPLLAKHYRIATPGAGGRTATAPGRTGLLTHASVLTVNGDADASIVLRGLYVMRKVLCQDVPPPPVGATSVMLAPATASQRAKSDARLGNQTCNACHGQFDPLAYAFEPYDNMGAAQTKDENGNAVRSDGWLTAGATKTPYTGADDYMAALAKDPRVGDCLANRVAQFAWGRAMQGDDACFLEDVRGRLPAAATRTYADVVSAIASSPFFVYTAVQ